MFEASWIRSSTPVRSAHRPECGRAIGADERRLAIESPSALCRSETPCSPRRSRWKDARARSALLLEGSLRTVFISDKAPALFSQQRDTRGGKRRNASSPRMTVTVNLVLLQLG